MGRSSPVIDATQWSTRELLAELERRQNATGRPKCGGKGQGWYDMAAHVFALFLILALSTLGTSLRICLT